MEFIANKFTDIVKALGLQTYVPGDYAVYRYIALPAQHSGLLMSLSMKKLVVHLKNAIPRNGGNVRRSYPSPNVVLF